jgi:hypothetical protein
VVTAPTNGYYDIGLRYSAGPLTGAPTNRTTKLRLNGSDLTTVSLTGTKDWNTWNTSTTKVFLTAGINQIEVNAHTQDDADAINVDYIDVTSTTGTITAYQAEASTNTLAGTASVKSNDAASGGKYVGFVGGGSNNTVRFNDVTVSSAGRYRMVVTYANGELGDGADNYNTNVVDRYADISVNGETAKRTYFRNTLGWSNYRTTVVDVILASGSNTITFANTAAYAPDLDLIQIAAPIG